MTPTPRTTSKGSPEGGEPFVGYIRVSTWKEEKISPELQRTAIEDWARRTGNRITKWIIDLDATGRNFKRKITQGIEHVEKGHTRGIAVWKYSRFGRDRHGNQINIARLESVGGRLESATEQSDVTTAVGRFQRGIHLELAAFESDRAGEQWKETHEHRRNHGLPSSGRPRFGYIWHRRWDPATQTLQEERYEPCPETGPVLADCYRRYTEGVGFAQLCADLNTAGHRTPKGRTWTAATLRRYMDTGFAAGFLNVHDPNCGCTRPWCPNTELLPGAHEAIISPELWNAYLQRRTTVRAMAPRVRTPTYPLTGLIRHAACGHGMGAYAGGTAGKKTNGYGYRCSHAVRTGRSGCQGVSITRARLEAFVLDWLATQAATGIDNAPPTPIPAPRTPADDAARAERERARLQGELERITAALQRLAVDNALDPDKYPPGVYEAARDQLVAEQGPLLTALEALAERPKPKDRAEYQPVVVGVLEEWDTLTAGEKNQLLRSLLRRVVVWRPEGVTRGGALVEVHPVWEADPWEGRVRVP